MKHVDLDNKKILVTGSAGFIGSNLVKRLLEEMNGGTIVGIDNMNDYYDVSHKEYRLHEREGLRKFAEWYEEYYCLNVKHKEGEQE